MVWQDVGLHDDRHVLHPYSLLREDLGRLVLPAEGIERGNRMPVDADCQLPPALHFACEEPMEYKRKVAFDNRQFFINYLVPPPPSFIFK